MTRNLVFFATALIAAGQPRMSVPALGYIFDDNAKVIRLVSGVPGAASVDSAIAAGAALDTAFVHSRARVAIANTKEGSAAIVQWTDEARMVPLTTGLGRITLAAFNRKGDTAAISDGSAIEVWSSLGSDPSRTAAYTPDSGVTALAINEDGIIAAASGDGSVLRFADETRPIASGGDWVSLAFLPNGKDLLAADAASQSVVLIRDGEAQSSLANVGQKPGALRISSDGAWAALALDQDVMIIGIASGETRIINCACHVSRFDSLEGNLVAHLVDTAARSGGVLLLDADGLEPRIATVPELNLGGVR
jgi:DNA-binding beta-propeller fold protein YncE